MNDFCVELLAGGVKPKPVLGHIEAGWSQQLATILIMDDDPEASEFMRQALAGHDCRITPEFDSAMTILGSDRVDLAIVEAALPGNESLQVLEAIGDLPDRLPFLVVARAATLEQAVGSFRLHACDFLTKPLQQAEFERVVARALGRQRSVPATGDEVPASLSPREREVFDLMLEGMAPAEVSARLFISLHTAKNHIKSIYRKLGVSSHIQLLARFLSSQD